MAAFRELNTKQRQTYLVDRNAFGKEQDSKVACVMP